MFHYMLLASFGMLSYWMIVYLCVLHMLHVQADTTLLQIYTCLYLWTVKVKCKDINLI